MVYKISKDAKRRASVIPGDVVSVLTDDGKFAILKVLVIDEAGVYGLLYAKLFMERPLIVNIYGLQIAPFGPVHFALTHEHFALCHPEVITHRQVTENELRDYPLWAIKNSDSREWPGRMAVD
jgi:hypothetical protein